MTPYEFAVQDLARKTAANGGMSSRQMMAGSSIGGSDMPMLNGAVTQASVGGINLATGQPISSPTYGSGVTGGTAGLGLGPIYSAAQSPPAPAAGGGASASDAFFASANAPMQTGQVVSMTPNGATGGAAYNTATLNSLMTAYRKQSEQARNDSLAQHAALMSSVTGSMKQVNGYLDQLGKSGETRIAQNEAKGAGQAEQDAISRGLGNTTIRNNLLGGVHRDAEQARQQLGETVAAQKIGTTMNLAQMYGDALLSKQIIPPDNSYLQLIQQLANGRA